MTVVRGGGIGALPTYAPLLSPELVPILPEFDLRRDVWLVYPPDIIRIDRVMAVMKWVKSIFDPVRHPWFREDLVPMDRWPSLA